MCLVTSVRQNYGSALCESCLLRMRQMALIYRHAFVPRPVFLENGYESSLFVSVREVVQPVRRIPRVIGPLKKSHFSAMYGFHIHVKECIMSRLRCCDAIQKSRWPRPIDVEPTRCFRSVARRLDTLPVSSLPIRRGVPTVVICG